MGAPARGERSGINAGSGDAVIEVARHPGSFFALFTDATSGITTYRANRSLAIDATGADGSVVLDFNRATNLVCACTDFATCPLPPVENRLPVATEAGEKIPDERLESATSARPKRRQIDHDGLLRGARDHDNRVVVRVRVLLAVRHPRRYVHVVTGFCLEPPLGAVGGVSESP